MVPLTLTLKNFLSYGDDARTLDFRNFHIACLSGRNGHGKSALIDALTWALWGKCRVKIKEEVIKRGASGASVELEFESEGTTYRILRSIERKQRGTASSVDIQILDEDTGIYKPLDEGAQSKFTIEDILKMDYNSFICSSFILQGMADEFTKRTPAERKDILSKILELDEFEALTKKARERSQNWVMELSALEKENNQIEEEIGRQGALEEDLKQANHEGEKVTERIDELEREHDKASSEYEAVRVKLEDLKKHRSDKEEKQETLVNIDGELAKLALLIKEDGELVLREKEIMEGFGEYEQAVSRDKRLTEKQLLVSNMEKELESENNLINQEKAALEKRVSSLKSRREEIRRTIKAADDTIKREKIITANYNKLSETVSLEKKLNEKKTVQDAVDSRRRNLEKKIELERAELASKARELADRIKDAGLKIGDVRALKEEIMKIKTLIGELGEVELNAEKLKESLKRTDEDKRACASEKTEMEKRKKDEESKLAEIMSQPDGAHCPLCESPLQQEARDALIEKLEREISGLDKKINEIGKMIQKLETRGSALTKEVKECGAKTKGLPAKQKELGVKEQSLKESEAYSKELLDLKTRLDDLSRKAKEEDYAHGSRKALTELTKEEAELGYEPELHLKTRKERESLGKFESEYELLKKDKARKSAAEKEIEDINRELEPLDKKLEEGRYAEKSRRKIEDLKRKIEESDYSGQEHTEIKETLGKLAAYPAEKEKLDRARHGLSLRREEEKKLKERIKAEKERVQSLEKKIKEYSNIESESKEIKEKLSSISEQVSLLKKTKEEVLVRITRAEAELSRMEKLAARNKEVKDSIKKAGHDLTVLRELAKAFGKNGLQALIIEQVVPEIEIEANKILSKLTEGSMALSLEMVKPTQKGGEKETLEIYIGDSSGTRSYETFSGGEAFRIDFALRVAISKFIANRSGAQLRTLVIDEGFGTQDQDGLNQFVQVINTIQDDFDKILAITHVDELKERFPVRIEVTKEPGEGSSFEVTYT
jgi:exonuclease SbcC